MKKFFTFCLMVSALFSIDAMAVCSGTQQWCSFYANPGGEGCCIPMTEVCGPDSCKTITPITACEGLVCENKTTWTDYGSDGKQIMCNMSSNTCEYRCNPDGYYRTSVGGGSAMRCAECPSNATCSDGTSVCCNQGHYPVTNVYMAPGAVGQVTEYTCPSCPGYLRYLSATSPTGMYVPGTTDANFCPGGIGACYIPSGAYSGDTSGRFQVTGKCKYQES